MTSLVSVQGEDIQKLEEEIVSGKEHLELAKHLLAECGAVRKRGRRKERRRERKGNTKWARKGGENKTNMKLLSSNK